MKRYFFIGIIIIVSAILFKTSNTNAQGSDKIKAFNQSINYEANNDYKNALDILVKLSGTNNSYLMNMRLGWLYYKTEDYKNSKKFYTSAYNQNKNSIEAMLGLTLPLASLEEWDAVKNLYESIIKIDQNNYYANLRLGQIYLNNGDYTTAKKYLENVMKYYPGEYEVNLSLGWTYYYIGEKEKAKQLFTTTIMINANDESATEGLKKMGN